MFVELISFTFSSISIKHFLLIIILFAKDTLSSRHSSFKKNRAEAYFLFYNLPVHSPNVFLTIYHSILARESCANLPFDSSTKANGKRITLSLGRKIMLSPV